MGRLYSNEYYDRQKEKRKKYYDKEREKKRREDYYKKYPEAKKKRINNLKEYMKEIRKLSKELGNCTYCNKENDNTRYLRCSKCREKIRNYQREYYRKNGKNNNK